MPAQQAEAILRIPRNSVECKRFWENKMIVRKFKKEDLAQVLELCREVRQHHIDILNGYFTQQDDQFEQLGFLQSLEDDKMCALVAVNDDIVCGY